MSRAVLFALTGEDVGETPAGGGVAEVLEAHGFDRNRLLQHVADRRACGERWPHPVPAVLLGSLGAAQLQAAIAQARAQLGLVDLVPQPPSTRTRLDADERRLLADVPPHHGV